jgi:putative hemolysin
MFADLGVEFVIILALTLANGFFSGSEIAIVSARRGRLEAEAKAGKRSAQQAIHLADNPDRFLATVQVGITLIGTFSAAFGGARIGDILAESMRNVPALAPYAETLSLTLVVVSITYISLILGELVPKRLALQGAERWAMIAAPVMTVLSQIARPVVAFLTLSVSAVLRLLGRKDVDESGVTEEDITYVLREGAASGVVEAGEARFIQRVFQFTDRPVRAVMTPRTEMVTVEVQTPLSEIAKTFIQSKVSRIPVYEDGIDNIIGILHSKDLLRCVAQPETPVNLRDLLMPVIFLIETAHVDDVMTTLRQKGIHMAVVVDEYGQTSGIVTMEDLLEELVGEIRDEYDQAEEHPIMAREDGTWLVDGLVAYDRVKARIGLQTSDEDDSEYTTLGGMMLALLDRIPVEGDTVTVGDHVLEVIDMDGRRIDKVLIRPKQETKPEASDQS